MGNFDAFEQKMAAAGMREAVIRTFRRNYDALLRNETGLIPEETIAPAENLAPLDGLGAAPASPELLGKSVVIKLNGGLGTSMNGVSSRILTSTLLPLP